MHTLLYTLYLFHSRPKSLDFSFLFLVQDSGSAYIFRRDIDAAWICVRTNGGDFCRKKMDQNGELMDHLTYG